MNKLFVGTMIAAVACGCVSYNKNTGDDADLKQVVVKDVIHQKLSVEDKTVTAENNINCLFGLFSWGGYATTADQSDAFLPFPDSKAKNGAYAKACDEANCDQLAAARYKITTTDYFIFTQIKAEVTGYPTKVTGVEILAPKSLAPTCNCVEKR